MHWPRAQAEIEHFVHPDDKSHPRFPEVADLEPLLYSRCARVWCAFVVGSSGGAATNPSIGHL